MLVQVVSSLLLHAVNSLCCCSGEQFVLQQFCVVCVTAGGEQFMTLQVANNFGGLCVHLNI